MHHPISLTVEFLALSLLVFSLGLVFSYYSVKLGFRFTQFACTNLGAIVIVVLCSAIIWPSLCPTTQHKIYQPNIHTMPILLVFVALACLSAIPIALFVAWMPLVILVAILGPVMAAIVGALLFVFVTAHVLVVASYVLIAAAALYLAKRFPRLVIPIMVFLAAVGGILFLGPQLENYMGDDIW
ncbi:hypothetical protein VTK26DRAFT_3607 [Humicola hyalothermophila]